MTSRVELRLPRFRLRTLLWGVLAIAIATGFVAQQIRLTKLEDAAERGKREPILLFRDLTAPDRIGAFVGGGYVYFDGEAHIRCRKGTLLARADGERLVVEWGGRTEACSTFVMDPESGRTVADDPNFFERLGIDFDFK